MKLKDAVTEIIIDIIWTELQNTIKETNKLNAHIDITKVPTRFWLTSSWYLRWRRRAKNLSTLTATTPRNEASENKFPEMVSNRLALQLGSFSSKVFKFFGNVEVFRIAQIVTIFNIMAV